MSASPVNSNLSARLGLHSLRLMLLSAIVALLHWQHLHYLAVAAQQRPEFLPLEVVQKYFPTGEKSAPSAEIPGGQAIYSAAGERLGTLVQTSPMGDQAIGFSGPTNVLLVGDAQHRILGVEILSSRDTREHVQQVQNDPKFLPALHGSKLDDDPPRIAAVAGATLTSYAILEAVQRRLGHSLDSLKFTESPTLSEVQSLFPQAASFVIDADDPSALRVRAEDNSPLGWILRTSPAADNIVGYQGPTDVLIGFSHEGKTIGVAIRRSYDNEPYVGYVRDDEYFRYYFKGKTIAELSQLDLQSSGVEGVSGATMTSLAVAKGMFAAAQQRLQRENTTQTEATTSSSEYRNLPWNEIGSVVVVLSGVLLSFSRWRGHAYVRLVWQGIVIGYLGFFHGTLLAQALFVGWAQNGVPLNAIGLICLGLAAVTMPIFAKRNVYCSQLCPHGAVQQLTHRWLRPRRQLPPLLKGLLTLVPAVLLTWSLLVGMLHWPFSLVDIEPFDAYIWRVAGGATLMLAMVGILASCFVPMAYCKYGCPTGALLEYLRLNARSDRWTRADTFAVACVIIAIACVVFERVQV